MSDDRPKTKKDWKDHLLSSGLPLEYSVYRVLEELGIRYIGEYDYERVTENGISSLFSVDVHATQVSMLPDLFLELFIECKYRHDGVRWVFAPTGRRDRFAERFPGDMLIALDHLTDGRKLNRNRVKELLSEYPLCSKGIEILPNDPNPKSIKEGIQQLRFALVEEVARALMGQVDKSLGEKNPIFVFVAMLVTTAELWRMKAEVTIEAVRKSDRLEDIATRREAVLLYQKPDRQLKHHTMIRLTHGLSAQQTALLNAATAEAGMGGIDSYADWFSSNYPCIFLILEYERFEHVIGKLLEGFKNPSVVRLPRVVIPTVDEAAAEM